MEQDQFCKVLCRVELGKRDVDALKTIIREEYHHNWIIDNLPAASIVDSEQYIITAYAGGFPVGYADHKASYLFNHVNIIVESLDPRGYAADGIAAAPRPRRGWFSDESRRRRGRDAESSPM